MRTVLPITLLLLAGCNYGLSLEDTALSGGESPYGGETEVDDPGGGGPNGGGPNGGGPNGGGPDGGPDGGGTDSGGTDGGDTEPANNPPIVTSFDAYEDGYKIRFDFTLQDDDDDLTGGVVSITVGADTVDYTYPVDLLGPSDNPYVTWSADPYERERSYTATIRVTDVAGNRSDTASDTFERGPWTAEIDEVGDTRWEGPDNIGEIELPAELYGDIYLAGDGSSYGDQDWIKFKPPDDETLTFKLTWSAGNSADYDLYLTDATGNVLAQEVSTTFGEELSYYVYGGESYMLGVAAWDGATGDWTIRIE